MADNKLNIEINATVNGLNKGLKKAEDNVKEFSDKSSSSLGKVDVSTKNLGKTFGKLKQSSSQVSSGINDITKSSGSLSDQLQGVSKISSGVSGSIAAISATGVVLAGTFLAIAAAIGVGLYLYGKQRAEAFDLELQYKKLNDRIKEYEKTLFGIDKVLLKGNQGAASSIASLESLRKQIDNTNISQGKRLEAVNEIQKLYPTYFGSLDDEKILLGDVGGAYDALTDDILKNARAKAGLSALTENLKKQFALEKQLLDKSVEISETIYKRKTLQATDYANKVGGAVGSTGQGIITLEEKEIVLLNEHKAISDDIVSVQKESQRIAKLISDNGGILPLGSGGAGDIATKLKNVKQVVTGELIDTFEEIKPLTDAIGIQIASMGLSEEEAKRMQESISGPLNKMKENMSTFADEIRNIITFNIGDAFFGIGTAIGEALATGGNVLQAVGGALLDSFGRFLGDMGAKLIEYGTLAILKGKLDLAILAGGPISIAAGIAAVAVGIALVAASAAIGNRAKKGLNGSGGTSTSVSSGVGGGTQSFGGSRGGSNFSSGGGTYVFEIAGTKLIGVLKNTLDRNKALGGSLILG